MMKVKFDLVFCGGIVLLLKIISVDVDYVFVVEILNYSKIHGD